MCLRDPAENVRLCHSLHIDANTSRWHGSIHGVASETTIGDARDATIAKVECVDGVGEDDVFKLFSVIPASMHVGRRVEMMSIMIVVDACMWNAAVVG